jgi:hypothetical protein
MAVITNMKTRKSRFFWILMCLLGEPQFSGIVAVAPRSLRLPSLDTVSPGTILWLQTSHQDDVCLGMTGDLLYECGDTTLWVMEPLVHQHHDHNNDPKKMDRFELRVVDHMDEDDDDDQNARSTNSGTTRIKDEETRRERRIRRREAECLTRRDEEEDDEVDDAGTSGSSILRVGACHHHQQHRWWWKIWKKNRKVAARSIWSISPDGKLTTPNGDCIAVGGEDGRTATLTSCSDEAAIVWTFLKAQPQHQPFDAEEEEDDSRRKQRNQLKKKKWPRNNQRAVEPAMHPELKVQSNLLFQRSKQQAAATASKRLQQHPPQHLPPTATTTTPRQPPRTSLPLHAALSNAILLAHHHHHYPNSSSSNRRKGEHHTQQHQSGHRLHTPNLGGAMAKVQRIQTHPYLNAAHNEVWTDPATGLEFRTDLRHYLHHSETKGRHTLTGVGIYRKYGIKVYGVAYYVSKDDVLAEPLLAPFAGLTADELRHRPDFYALLRSDEVRLDRTILIKTNMQLSAETMRNSLQADWSYLTADAKKLLAETGMQKLPADETMVQTILRATENPSRCSCMQTTAHLVVEEPVVIAANEECCARGTELAFTWTKHDTLEVRIVVGCWLFDCLLFDCLWFDHICAFSGSTCERRDI